jgi:hypothetical protein
MDHLGLQQDFAGPSILMIALMIARSRNRA